MMMSCSMVMMVRHDVMQCVMMMNCDGAVQCVMMVNCDVMQCVMVVNHDDAVQCLMVVNHVIHSGSGGEL